MDRYLEIAKKESLCGIGAEHWLSFFKIFQEQKDEESINAELNRLRALVTGTDKETDQQITDALEKIVSGIDDLLYQRQT